MAATTVHGLRSVVVVRRKPSGLGLTRESHDDTPGGLRHTADNTFPHTAYQTHE